MKDNKLAKILLAAAAPCATFGNIALTDTLSVKGFIDGSYSYVDTDNEVGADTNAENIGIDQVDVDFHFDTESVAAEVHLSSPSSGDIAVEQAFFSYDLGGGAAITAGKYLSLHGYEGDEPYTLYQYSYAYDFGTAVKIPFAGYHSGIKASYGNDQFSAVVSIVDSVYGTNSAGGSAEDLGFEAQIKYTGIENLVVAFGTAQDDQGVSNAGGIDDYWNLWVEYSGIDKVVLAAEWNTYEFAMQDADSWMLMGNYAVSDKVGVTLRYSETDEEAGFEADKWTIAPSYSFSDNLLGVVEYSQADTMGTAEVDTFAVEMLWTF